MLGRTCGNMPALVRPTVLRRSRRAAVLGLGRWAVLGRQGHAVLGLGMCVLLRRRRVAVVYPLRPLRVPHDLSIEPRSAAPPVAAEAAVEVRPVRPD